MANVGKLASELQDKYNADETTWKKRGKNRHAIIIAPLLGRLASIYHNPIMTQRWS
jgi:hypothetical protein